MSESRAVEAAFGSCAKWFPLIGRIDIAIRPGSEQFAWEPTPAQWREAAGFISQLIAEFGEHSQTIRDAVDWPLEFSQLPTTRIQFGRDAHFSGTYGRQWESAALAVVDETERLLNELQVSFDPLCDLNSVSGTFRAREAVPETIPTSAQLVAIQQVVNQFCMQCDIPRVCSELREQIEAERKCLLLQSASPIDFDDVGDFPSMKMETSVASSSVGDLESEATGEYEEPKKLFAESTAEVPSRYRNPSNLKEHWGPLTGSGAKLAKAISGNPKARRPYLEKHHEGKIFVRQMTDRELEVYFEKNESYLKAKRAFETQKSATETEHQRLMTTANDTQ